MSKNISKNNSTTMSKNNSNKGARTATACFQPASRSRAAGSGGVSKKEYSYNRKFLRHANLSGNFRLCNESGSLKLYSEVDVNGLKGVVFENNKKVMNAFPRVTDLVVGEGQITPIENKFIPNDEWVKSSRFTHHVEGALIRVYWASNTWNVSTQKKINAFNSKWSGPESFGETWAKGLIEHKEKNPEFLGDLPVAGATNNILNHFFKTLNKKHQYVFVVRHTAENRQVCQSPEKSTVFHIATFIDDKLNVDDDVGLNKPDTVQFENVEELVTLVESQDFADHSGLMAHHPNGNWYKIQSRKYREMLTVRGNEPSLRFRYLQLRLDCEKVNQLYSLFPEMSETFDNCEDSLYDLAKYIHTAYMDRFIRRRYVTLEREFFSIVRLCHEWHKQDRQRNKVDLDKVIEVINTRYDHVLNKMIKMFNNMTEEEIHAERPSNNNRFHTESGSDPRSAVGSTRG